MTEDKRLYFTHDFFLPATPERSFAACVEGEALQAWFAERAEVEPRVGGSYRFWGRSTPGGIVEESADQQISVFEPSTNLGFAWTWVGVPSEVRMELSVGQEPNWGCEKDPGAEKPMGTSLKLSHRLEAPLPYPRPDQFVDDFWRLSMGNLSAYLKGQGNVVLVDHQDPEPEVRLSVDIDAAPAAVFRALTEPGLLNQWLASAATIEPRLGGAFDLGWGAEGAPAAMRILVWEPDRAFAFSWPDWRGTAGVPDQQVRFDLEARDGGTRVHLLHSGFERAVDRSDFQQGWPGFLDGLQRVCRTLGD